MPTRAEMDARLTAKIKSGAQLTPEDQKWLRQNWGATWLDKANALKPTATVPAPAAPPPGGTGGTPMPMPTTPTPATPAPPPRIGAQPAPVTPKTPLEVAASKVTNGEPLTPADEALLRKAWPGQIYWDKIKQYSPPGSPNLPTWGINPPKTGQPNAPGAKTPTKEPAPTTPTTPTQPTTPPPPGTVTAPTPQPSVPLPTQTPLTLPTAPNTPNLGGMDGGVYPKWLTDLLADPAKLKDPKNIAAIENYLKVNQDARTAAQYLEENKWRQGQDTFNMDLSKKQHEMAVWQAKQTQINEENRLKLDTTKVTGDLNNTAISNANWYDVNTVANKNTATANEYTHEYQTGQNANNATANANALAIAQAKQKLEDERLIQEAALNRENQANQLTQSRYSAFGRAKAPNTRSLRSWG